MHCSSGRPFYSILVTSIELFIECLYDNTQGPRHTHTYLPTWYNIQIEITTCHPIMIENADLCLHVLLCVSVSNKSILVYYIVHYK